MAGETMRAMVLAQSPGALSLQERPVPVPGPGQVLVRVHACGVCRTGLPYFPQDPSAEKRYTLVEPGRS